MQVLFYVKKYLLFFIFHFLFLEVLLDLKKKKRHLKIEQAKLKLPKNKPQITIFKQDLIIRDWKKIR